MDYLFLALKAVLIFFLFFLSVVALYFLIGIILSYWETSPKPVDCANNRFVYISSSGMHIDIILHHSDIDDRLSSEIFPIRNTQYFAFGWGDKGFYLETPAWSELKLSVAMRAMLIPSSTAMHITQYPELDPDWVKIPLCEQQFNVI